MNVVLLVVIFEQSIRESLTLQTLRLNLKSNFVGTLRIWDNSPTDDAREEAESFHLAGFKTVYEWHPDNAPLSSVYNNVCKLLFGEDFLIILDQDSTLPSTFLETMHRSALQNVEVKLFLPKVYNQNNLISPGKLSFFKGKHLASIESGVRPSKDILAITSGMMISAEYLHISRFDERLNLYGIDTRFMIDFSENETMLFVADTSISHEAALWSEKDASELLPRYRNLVRTWPIVFEKRFIAKALARVYGKFSGIKMALKFRDARFLRSG